MPPTEAAHRDPADILVRLYDLPPLDLARTDAAGVTIRRPIAPEKHVVSAWVGDHFGAGWVSETERAFADHPISCVIAIRDKALLGFACYDAPALGIFGPTGVAEETHGGSIVAALFLVTLQAMRDHGYAYAIVGGAGPIDFYQPLVDGIVIPGSWPGMHRGLLGWEFPTEV